ncbi:hypothetical protein Gorai_006163, partial [Gossypium raimondii]|nr:hypothetical protein [Gossypium raimondii]MBA0749532.1 hypothetical protein [Gossypium gossypioides]
MAEMLKACQGAGNNILHYMEMYSAAFTLGGAKFRSLAGIFRILVNLQ